MRTTEPTRAARDQTGPGREIRLYLTAALALSYLLAWWAFGAQPGKPPSAPEQRRAAIEPGAAAPSAVWYGDLPPSQRPAVRLPSGWQVAGELPTQRAAPRVRPLPARTMRIRTRSS